MHGCCHPAKNRLFLTNSFSQSFFSRRMSTHAALCGLMLSRFLSIELRIDGAQKLDDVAAVFAEIAAPDA